MNKRLLKKSLNVRNEEAISKLAQKDGIFHWAEKNDTIPLPKYEKPQVEPLSAGLWNMVKQMLP